MGSNENLNIMPMDCPEPARPLKIDNYQPDIYCPLAVSTDFCPTFSLYKSRNIFSSLETVFEIIVCCLPGVGLTEINSFFVSPSLSLCLRILSMASGWVWFVWGPWSQVLLHPCAWLCIYPCYICSPYISCSPARKVSKFHCSEVFRIQHLVPFLLQKSEVGAETSNPLILCLAFLVTSLHPEAT